MSATVAHQVVERVEALMRDEGVVSRAEAIRRVAAEMDRSVPATSSAFYAGRRAAEAAAQTGPPTGAGAVRARSSSSSPRLFAEMLPLVEAGASIEQAARRFGDDDDAGDIASRFARWLLDERAADAGGADLAEAWRRVTALEAEVRSLRRDLARAHGALSRVREIAADAAGDTPGR